MANKRILFVDDEQHVLHGLRRMLRTMRHEWQMEFAQSGGEALEKLSQMKYDVVVSDMRMPGMDGADLLREVMNLYPETVRIILSGHADEKMIMKSIGPAHQYLAKPCDAETLKGCLDHLFSLRTMVSEDSLHLIVSRIDSLPSLPTLYQELMHLLQSPDVTMKQVGEVISKDVGMTAKLLQLVNSAFFGLGVKVTDPTHAARLLGPETLKGVLLTTEVFTLFENMKCKKLSLKEFSDHSLWVGSVSKRFASDCRDQKASEQALVAGMLHDTGKLILAENLPELYDQTLSIALDDNRPLWQIEKETLGATHSEIGAYLLGLWGLPDTIVEAVLLHHCPSKAREQSFGPLTAVHLADAFSHGLRLDQNGGSENALDMTHLHEVGCADQLAALQEVATNLKQRYRSNL